jgi:hypothetical protein
MALTWPKGQKKIPITLREQYSTLGANVAVIKYCCFHEIHNVGSRIKVNLRPNPISSISSHFISLHFLLFLLSICDCLWIEEVSMFSTCDMVIKFKKILCLCSFTVVWFVEFSLRKGTKIRRMIPRKKNESMLRVELLILIFFKLTHELIDPKQMILYY